MPPRSLIRSHSSDLVDFLLSVWGRTVAMADERFGIRRHVCCVYVIQEDDPQVGRFPDDHKGWKSVALSCESSRYDYRSICGVVSHGTSNLRYLRTD